MTVLVAVLVFKALVLVLCAIFGVAALRPVFRG